jgi:hypothetical protein
MWIKMWKSPMAMPPMPRAAKSDVAMWGLPGQ